MKMENLFNLYSILNCTKYIEENTVRELSKIKNKWKITEEVSEYDNFELEQNNKKNIIKTEEIHDDFYSEVDKLIAKAQESIKLDHHSINIKPTKNGKSK